MRAASAESARLDETLDGVPWKRWGPYLSERQWGTVREDYSDNGDAWDYFTHDQARSRAYHWGEDGIAGISDDRQRLCFALALWNGQDPILKERMFGLTNSEGNHGEDVKEYYFYVDSTPTHSYMRYLYKYPQAAYPYADLVATNASRSRNEMEYELIDTGVFDEDRYFDVEVEYAKASPDDLCIRITATNRGPERATLHLLPTLWFRNTWSWGGDVERPVISRIDELVGTAVVDASHEVLGRRRFAAEDAAVLLFTVNETNTERLTGLPNHTPYVKDAFHRYLVDGDAQAVNPAGTGTKVAAHYTLDIDARSSATVRLRLWEPAPEPVRSTPTTNGHHRDGALGDDIDAIVDTRRAEADAFYATVIPSNLDADETNVVRQALAGMLWSKQHYFYDVDRWLEERGSAPFSNHRRGPSRNDQWPHLYNADILSMPDKWEYPWFAAWDLAFHVLALTMVDQDFGKDQLSLILRDQYLHPSGQIPAYEWNFGDVNPPVHAWATIFTYRLEQAQKGEGDLDWLEAIFQKLLLNFTWWVNRKDRTGSNLFEGGFLGLDNIGVFDRSSPLPTGGYLEQADGTAWMALFCQNMIEISSELAMHRPAYAELAMKFVTHFLWIGAAMMHAGDGVGMWDDEDGFFYDVLRHPDGHAERLKVRSMVGLLPLCAVTVFEGKLIEMYPQIAHRLQRFLDARPELRAFIHDPAARGYGGRRLSAILDETRLRRVLTTMLDEDEFFGPHGIRAVSRYHRDHPYITHVGDQEFRVDYLPAESDSGMFGGNSNWRGPVWMPVNGLIVRALIQYHAYYGDSFKIECPTGSGRLMNLYEVAAELSGRLSSIFTRDEDGRRPVYGGTRKFQEDPHWRDLLLFYEYYGGDDGAGLGASHQTGWSGAIARLMHVFATTTSEEVLVRGKMSVADESPLDIKDRAETVVADA